VDVFTRDGFAMMAAQSKQANSGWLAETLPAKGSKPTSSQRFWLARGMDQAGGKLPLFDASGQKVSERTVRSCIKNGWAEPWFANPLKPDWIVCKLTQAGRALFAENLG